LRGLAMFQKLNVPILGVVENMSYFVCPHCEERTDIFGHGSVKKACDRLGVEFLGEVPLASVIRSGGDEGQPVVTTRAAEGEVFEALAGELAAKISIRAAAGIIPLSTV